MQLQENGAIDKAFDVFSGKCADFLECLATLADQDAFLGIPFNDNVGVDQVLVICALFPTDDIDLSGVGDLLPVELEDLLTNDFGDEEAFRLFADHFLRIESRAEWKSFQNGFENDVHIAPFESRCWDDLFEGMGIHV